MSISGYVCGWVGGAVVCGWESEYLITDIFLIVCGGMKGMAYVHTYVHATYVCVCEREWGGKGMM